MATLRRCDKGQLKGPVTGKEGKTYNYHNHPGLGKSVSGGLNQKISNSGRRVGKGAKNPDLKL